TARSAAVARLRRTRLRPVISGRLVRRGDRQTGRRELRGDRGAARAGEEGPLEDERRRARSERLELEPADGAPAAAPLRHAEERDAHEDALSGGRGAREEDGRLAAALEPGALAELRGDRLDEERIVDEVEGDGRGVARVP